MAPRKSTSKSKATAEAPAATAVPDQAPPLPDEAPPLPDEAPPLPDEAPPLPSDETPPLLDETPVSHLGGEDSDDEDGEVEEQEESAAAAETARERKGKAAAAPAAAETSNAADPGDWQAVWAPEQNAYYFWNKASGEVTWTNPLVPPPSATAPAPPLPDEAPPPKVPDSSTASGSRPRPLPAAVPDIDPALAHLLPPEQRGSDGAPIASLKHAPQDYNYAFTHLDEYNRAKRFADHYFDVEAWEKQKAAEALKRKADEEAGITSSKKVTKRDMERFKAQKAQQKARRQAWLYD